MNDCVIIIIGITGDLARRKLIPAIYKLMLTNRLEKFVLIGASIEDTSMNEILESAKIFIPEIDSELWLKLKSASYYVQVNALNPKDFVLLSKIVCKLEKKHSISGNRLLYCSTASDFFCPITEHSILSNLIERRTELPWHRIVYEKPFGKDLASAHEINSCIAHYLDDEQVYRIDHYLTEELVSNIALVRFTNCIFEPLWNNRYISHVQIILNEKVTVGSRGGYYDSYGALKDMVQNHALELLALIAMETPQQLTGEYIRQSRANVLSKVRCMDALLGQYEGYKNELYVNPQSLTETFAALQFFIDNPRWAGVPFYIKTGKALHKKDTAVHIKFKQVDCLKVKQCRPPSNYLTIQVTPNPSFALSLNVKKPGFSHEVTPVAMEFCHSCIFKGHGIESYEVLLQEVINGEHSISVRFDEIEYAWKVIDTIKAMNLPLHSYVPESSGPQELEFFENKHGMRWRA